MINPLELPPFLLGSMLLSAGLLAYALAARSYVRRKARERDRLAREVTDGLVLQLCEEPDLREFAPELASAAVDRALRPVSRLLTGLEKNGPFYGLAGTMFSLIGGSQSFRITGEPGDLVGPVGIAVSTSLAGHFAGHLAAAAIDNVLRPLREDLVLAVRIRVARRHPRLGGNSPQRPGPAADPFVSPGPAASTRRDRAGADCALPASPPSGSTPRATQSGLGGRPDRHDREATP